MQDEAHMRVRRGYSMQATERERESRRINQRVTRTLIFLGEYPYLWLQLIVLWDGIQLVVLLRCIIMMFFHWFTSVGNHSGFWDWSVILLCEHQESTIAAKEIRT